jgi:acyl carrier protein
VAAAPDRAEIVAILAAFGDRSPDEVPESVDSMELAWLVHQLEQRYELVLGDDELARMETVADVLRVLGERLPAAAPGAPGGSGAGT